MRLSYDETGSGCFRYDRRRPINGCGQHSGAPAITKTQSAIDEQALLDDLTERAFATSTGPPRVGLEIEMLVVRDHRAATIPEILDAIAPLIELRELEDTTVPGSPPCLGYGSTGLTFEPGGQIEIVSPPHTSIARALEDVAKLEMLLDRVLLWRGMRRLHVGINPWQDAPSIQLQTPLPRYLAMQDYFARIGSDGARMMRLCCAIQINLDTGSPSQMRRRWRLANLVTPVFTAMFANSPFADGHPSGWKSTRAAVWQGVDPSRTGVITGEDGPSAYHAFALDAGLLLRRTRDGYLHGNPGFTFRDWLAADEGPTLDDWHYHLTTLFPQVRPRGFFELRCFDALPPRWRAVPVAVASALLMGDDACARGIDLLEPHRSDLDSISLAGARGGLDDPTVATLARSVMRLAQDGLPGLPEDWISADIASCVGAYDEWYTARGRCPADDLLDTGPTEVPL
jgi:glutamate--cysteine ligase